MKFTRYMLLAAVSMAAFCAKATDITTTAPGTLKEQIADPMSITTLRVSGPVDVRDLQYIGRELTALQSLDLGSATVQGYAGDAWDGVPASESALIPHTAFAGSGMRSLVLPSQKGLRLGVGALCGVPLTSLTFPTTQKIILEEGALAGTALTSVTIPSNIVLGPSAFAQCPSLTRVTLQNVTDIPASAFRGCSALTTVAGAPAVVNIGASAFEGCTSLKSFAFGTALRSLGAQAFASTGLVNVALGDCRDLTEVGAMAFANCPSLETANLPGSLNSLGEGIFFDDTRLRNINIPSGITILPKYALKGARLLDLAPLKASNVASIDDYALMGHDSIPELVLPATLAYLGDGAMEGMKNLKDIDATAIHSVPELGQNVWMAVNQGAVRLVVPASLEHAYSTTPQWQNFNIDVATGNADILGDKTDNQVRGAWQGKDLVITSSRLLIERVTLVDPSGRLLVAAEPHAQDIVIDTSDFDATIYLAGVLLEDGTKATVKMARRP